VERRAVLAWPATGGGTGPEARLAGADVLIAGGTLVLGAGGLFNSVLDAMEAFAVTLLVGITLLFAGFLVATGVGKPGPV